MNEIKKANFHTHTTFCDGRSTAEEMVLSAIKKGFELLGFSSHSMYPFSSSWHIPVKDFDAYCKEICRLKEAYKNKIEIRLGFEADYIPGITCPDKNGDYKEFQPDFLLGSVHYLVNENGNFTLDDKTENVRAGLLQFYSKNKDCATFTDCGKPLYELIDSHSVVHDYFEAQRQMLKKGNFDILGHPDLIRIRNAALRFFEENDDFYKEELKLTAKVAARAGVICEINTGAIARGSMDDLYPSEYFLGLLYDAGVPVCINSDAHDAQKLDAAFDRAVARAVKVGYKELRYPGGISRL